MTTATNHTTISDRPWEAPHSDESGASRPVLIGSALSGEDSAKAYHHLTPKEEAESNAAWATLAEKWG